MGNRWASYETEWFNPLQAPYLHFVQGAKWGYTLVDGVCARLQREGYKINPLEVACLGRGKRIPQYRLAFEKLH
ncbi:hypothetical protein HZA99_04135 [Candidatus Woesearchaeota archaeon]|nr:hypothetical protein [Candidatus Woesearchaeota archaeon]